MMICDFIKMRENEVISGSLRDSNYPELDTNHESIPLLLQP